MSVPTIVFIRHGETDWNVEERLQGQRDIPLNDRGRLQARRNGETVLAELPEAIGYDFVASPLTRSRDTMEIVRTAMGLDPKAYRLDDRLRELTFGEWEGFTLAELSARYADAVSARQKDKWGYLPPGGESYRLLSERVAGWLAELRAPTFAVAHGGVGRVLCGLLLGRPPEAVVSMEFPQDRVLLIENGTGTWL
ncbi:MAG TPA: histidine phosphatase family protein [Bauldia sp.]|nr:histidine phosphatase family protein [Bauldia sp.]